MSTLQPYNVSPSNVSYGADGPWNTVVVGIGGGTTAQYVSLFPRGQEVSFVLTSKSCQPFGEQCGEGGVYNPLKSANFYNSSQYKDYTGPNYDSSTYAIGALPLNGSLLQAMDQLVLTGHDLNGKKNIWVNNFSIAFLPSEYEVYLPNGNPYPLQAGQLALSSNESYFWQSSGEQSLIPGSMAPSAKSKTNKNTASIPSNSYGLHLGTAVCKQSQSASLWLGGYDQNRIAGPVSAQLPSNKQLMQIDLLDIGIGVDNGGSPFPFHSRQGLLANGNSSIGASLPVWMNPQAPYLYLPRSVCDSITRDLPITYNSTLDFYLWDTNSPNFTNIVTSPAFMSLSFRASKIGASNLTIKMPYKLLNLTLEPPLVSQPTAYFPCMDPRIDGRYSLGRAFMQAAFIGANWDKNEWYLAQAPGPNIASQPSPSRFGDTINGYSTSWSDSWRGVWTPLPSSGGASEVTSPGSRTLSGGLTEGAKAGIAVGVVVGVLAVIALVFFVLRRRRRSSPKQSESDKILNDSVEAPKYAGLFKSELAGQQDFRDKNLAEMHDPGVTSELPTGHQITHELETPVTAHERDLGRY